MERFKQNRGLETQVLSKNGKKHPPVYKSFASMASILQNGGGRNVLQRMVMSYCVIHSCEYVCGGGGLLALEAHEPGSVSDSKRQLCRAIKRLLLLVSPRYAEKWGEKEGFQKSEAWRNAVNFGHPFWGWLLFIATR